MEGVGAQGLVVMALSPEKQDFNPLEERVKNSWSPKEDIQCDKNLKVSSSDSESEILEEGKEMTLKTYQNTIMPEGELQGCKLDDSVFPLSPSTVGSRSPPPYPNYGDGFQQDSGYYENRYNNVNSVSLGNIYSSNQMPVSNLFMFFF